MDSRMDEYFANLPTKEVGDALLKKVEDYQEFLSTSGRLELYRRMYNQYYKALETGARLERLGEMGEFSAISVNDFRNILLHLITMTSSEKISPEPQAINTDHESIAQVILASGLLDYYHTEKRIDARIKVALETCLWAGDAFVALGWDSNMGEDYAVDERGEVLKLGDVDLRNYSPLTCVRDYNLKDASRESWKILVDYENRYELAAQYPELADRILLATADRDKDKFAFELMGNTHSDSDIIPVYEFRHERTKAVPNGRLVRFIDSDIILIDNPLPYKKTHVYRLCPAEQNGTIWGYTVGFDLLPVQTAIDTLNSICLTNISTFGVQNIMVPAGANLKYEELTGGLNVIEYDSLSGPPQPLQLVASSPETYNYLDRMIGAQERISAVNKVTRGQAESVPQLRSGAALAMIQSMAVQFTSWLQQSFTEMIEDVDTGIIEILQTFATLPRVAQIAGKSQKGLMKEWSNKDILQIRRVLCKRGNPMTKTTAGKINLAEQFMNLGMIENPDQLLQVYNTGKLEPATENRTAQLNLIRDENESLTEGKPVVAVITDDHDQHILEHAVVLSSTDARMNPELVAAVTEHIQEHLDLKRSQDPIIAALFKQIPAQGVVPPGGMPPQTPGPQGPIELAPEPSNPQMPTNPLTGQEFDPQTGGL